MKVKLIILLIMPSVLLFAQSGEWKVHNREGVTVKSRVSTYVGKEIKGKLIEYEATKMSSVDIDKAKKYLLDFSQHKHILDNTRESILVKTEDSGSYIVFLEFNAPWPMPDSDCVQRFSLKDDFNGFILEGVADPTAYKRGKHDRVQLYNMSYSFEQERDGLVKITIKGKFIPTSSPPKFLVKTWFPKGPIGIIERIENNIK